jgi:hypothetical protein
MSAPEEGILERLAIRERIDQYIDLINHRDWDAYEDLWTNDMVWTASEPIGMRIEGRSAMMDFLRENQAYGFGFLFQMAHGIVVELVDERRARSRHTLHVISNKFTTIGIYYDELVKGDDGLWRFRLRDYRITHHDPTELGGSTFRTLPDPSYRDLPDRPTTV